MASPESVRPFFRYESDGDALIHTAMANGAPGCSRLCVGLVDVDGPVSQFSSPVHAEWWQAVTGSEMKNQTLRNIHQLFSPG